MNKIKMIIMTEDEYNDLKVVIKGAMSDAHKLSENYPSYITGRIYGRLREALDILNKGDDEIV